MSCNIAVYRLDDGVIDNVITFAGESKDYTPPPTHGAVEIPGGALAGEHSMCGIGWSYIDGQFVEPNSNI